MCGSTSAQLDTSLPGTDAKSETSSSVSRSLDAWEGSANTPSSSLSTPKSECAYGGESSTPGLCTPVGGEAAREEYGDGTADGCADIDGDVRAERTSTLMRGDDNVGEAAPRGEDSEGEPAGGVW